MGIEQKVKEINWQWVILGAAAGLVLFHVIAPLGMLIYSSFRTVSPGEPGPFTLVNYVNAYFDGETYELLANTFQFAFVALSVGITLGVFFAWLVERTNTPLRNIGYALIPLTVATPSMLYGIAWVLLLSPQIGVINIVLMNIFGLAESPIQPYSIVGMGFVEGLRLASGTFLMVVGVFRSMDPAMEEAASTHGANTFTTARRITLRLMMPGILAATIYSLTTAFDTFEIPAIMGMRVGIHVFATKIYEASHSVPRDYGMTSTLGVILLVLAVFWVYLYGKATRRVEAYATVTGKGYRSRVIDLGRWKYVGTALFFLHFLIVIVAPVGIMVWGSLLPYYETPSLAALSKITLDSYWEIITFPWLLDALKNTAIMTLFAPTLAVLLSAVISWIVVRTKVRGRRMLDTLVFMPHAIPGIVMGLSFMWLYLRMQFIPIYGTIWIIIIAFATRHLAYGTRAMNAAMIQIHKELEEVAQTHGVVWLKIFIRITIPLLLPSFISVWIWSAMHVVRSLSIPIMLYSPDSRVLAVLIWDLWQSGEISYTCAIGVMLIFFLAVILFIGRRLAMRKARQY
ncbi:ABC transporter permease [Thermodesulfobacteriota bacterium]